MLIQIRSDQVQFNSLAQFSSDQFTLALPDPHPITVPRAASPQCAAASRPHAPASDPGISSDTSRIGNACAGCTDTPQRVSEQIAINIADADAIAHTPDAHGEPVVVEEQDTIDERGLAGERAGQSGAAASAVEGPTEPVLG